MQRQRLIIPERMPSLNVLLDAKGRGGKHAAKNGARWNPYNATKRQWETRIKEWCEEQGIQPMPSAHFRFTWLEPDRKRNPDNVLSGKKIIFDALVKANILPNDGWKQLLSIREVYVVNRRYPGVVVDMFYDVPL